MDVRKFAQFLIALGILIGIGGSVAYLHGKERYDSRLSSFREAMRPLYPDDSVSVDKMLEIHGETTGFTFDLTEADTRMHNGKMGVLGGGVIVVLGIAFLFSARKPETVAVV